MHTFRGLVRSLEQAHLVEETRIRLGAPDGLPNALPIPRRKVGRPRSSTPKKTVTFNAREDLLERLRQEAREESSKTGKNITVGYLLNRMMEEHFKERS